MVRANHAAGRLQFTTDAVAAITHGDVLFIAVGTPPDEGGGGERRVVGAVARSIGQHRLREAVIVIKSTVPVGTSRQVRAAIENELANRDLRVAFDVVSNPEFLKEGAAVNGCMRPDRIILGSGNAASIELLKQLYGPFNRNRERIVVMDERSAELTKYAAPTRCWPGRSAS
jgi:UDPglucose 6-dehydrogenase